MTGIGKRGGSRVTYYWLVKEDDVLLTLYAKGIKNDLTVAEPVAWRRAVEAIDND